MRRRSTLHMRARRGAGFTLLELLLALALMALLTAVLTGSLRLAGRAFQAGGAHQDADDLEAAATALSNLLAKAYPLVMLDAAKTEQPTFIGAPDGCRFVGLSEGEVQLAGLIATDIGLTPNAQGFDLAVWTAPVHGGQIAMAREAMRKTEAARHVATLSFSYFGVVEQDAPPRWSDTWQGTSRLPLLVALRFSAWRAGRLRNLSFVVDLRQTRS